MTKSIAFVAVLGLFILGILIGALGMHLIYAQGFPYPSQPGMGPGMHGRFFFAQCERELDLSAEQEEQIRQILTESMAAGRTMREEMLPRVQELMNDTRESIMKVLTPEQRRKFASLVATHRRDAERFFLGQGSGEGRGKGFRGRGRPQP